MFEFLAGLTIAYLIHTLGVSIGYHRLLAHRSYKCPRFVEYFWVMAGYLGFQSSPIWWASMHRAHHRYSDTPLDPHPSYLSWRRCIYGWIFDSHYPDHVRPEECSKDLVDDPLYKFLDQGGDVQRAHLLNGMINFLFRFLLMALFGLPFALGSLVAGLLIQQVTLIFNKLAHIESFGYRNADTTDDSVNVTWLAYLTLGEGLHNNHHAYPGSANNALSSSEYDFSFCVIKAMKSLGLVGWINDGKVFKAKLANKEMVPVPDSLPVSVGQNSYRSKASAELERVN